jgi:hypothetical protein
MANANTPFGLRPYSQMSERRHNGAVRTYYVLVGNSTALLGDPVMQGTNTSDSTSQLVAAVERRLTATGVAPGRRRRAAASSTSEPSFTAQ